jgi:putative Holliday junction resolvase
MPEAASPTGIALGFDFGLKRIGIAAGDTLTQGARPLLTVAARNGEPDWSAIDHCVREWGPVAVVVGVPYNMDGTESALTAAAKSFAAVVGARFAVPVAEVDERLSSREAEDQLRQRRASGERTRRVTHGDIDAVAAAVLLQQWLRENQSVRT